MYKDKFGETDFLLECQVKDLLGKFNLSVPPFIMLLDLEESQPVACVDTDYPCMLKAQVPINNRFQQGLVKKVFSFRELYKAVAAIRSNLTLINCGVVSRYLLLEKFLGQILHEYYICLAINCQEATIKITASIYGGRKVNVSLSFFVLTVTSKELEANHILELISYLRIPEKYRTIFCSYINRMFDFFICHDLKMLEINPLALVQDRGFVSLDAKALIDKSALFRQPLLANYYRENLKTIDDVCRKQALCDNLSYVSLHGNIAVVANGAGLAMATMDMLKDRGEKVEVFVDIAGNTNLAKITKIFTILFSNTTIDTVVINIFGGIMSCNKIASGLISALTLCKQGVQIFIRLKGRDSDEAMKALLPFPAISMLNEDLFKL